MPPVPDSSSTPNNSAIVELEAGLTALKQKDYPKAIALLEASTLPATHPLAIKAKMGLVVAYTRTGELDRALAQCQLLLGYDNPQVREWAERTQENLTKRYPEVLGKQVSANTRIGQESATANPASTSTESEVDLTGFVPFDGSSFPARSEPIEESTLETQKNDLQSNQVFDQTGFLPLNPKSDTRFNVDVSAKQEESIAYSSKELEDVSSPVSTAQDPSLKQESVEFHPGWRQAERATSPWKSLGKVDISRLVLLQLATAIVLVWVVQQVIYLILVTPGAILTSIPFLQIQQVLIDPPFWSIIVFLFVLLIASRWILDALLRLSYGLQPLTLNTLSNYSPETVQSLNRFCRQRKIPLPDLAVLPSAAPIALSYGILPRFTRLVVSQGLLEQLADDEIATIYAREIGHIAQRDVPLMSLLTVVVQIPYTIYKLVAEWGNRQTIRAVRELATWFAAAFYGLYQVLHFVGLWASRQRVYFGDRATSELTGNPNGYTRALLKIAIGTFKDVEQQGQTSYLLEGFDLLVPLEHRMAVSLGSLYPYTPVETVLEWDAVNPLRHWLSINHSHPPTGDRLHLLALYARHWKLPCELDFNSDIQTARKRQSRFSWRQWQTLLSQSAPFIGLAIGLLMALALSQLGALGWRFGNSKLLWAVGDQKILYGLALVGFSLGTFIRINPFFPDLTFPNLRGNESSASVTTLMEDPALIPTDSVPVRLQGKLLGRPGIANKLSQDILLQTEKGGVWLHCLSPLGPIGNLLHRTPHFTDFLGQDVTLTGWFRRGATAWIDVDLLRTSGGRTDRSNHPLWSTLLAFLTASIGIYLIARGSF